ncbi:enoyl-[acyl-carrier-protein] reductase FabK [Agrilactobacillus yilanensis]|uniref:Probable nitronate monooxygenase n=1 Tax=Agrilactobacillus yilanensis TaxID=2485997 RepID=A0ABW4J9P0_9LACO|nr:enoyl-[acyl-carrier-protein] reductase FabK [Agrilactobacillus yilanensis]
MKATAFFETLGIRYPIIQGGMAWVADGALAAAVSNGGGLGIIGAGNAPGEVVAEQIRVARSLTDRPFGVNVMLMSPFVEEVMAEVLKAHVPVVTTGAGNPGKYIDDLKAAGSKVVPVIPSVALARMMARTGADAVVAEGMESGGHIGQLTTMALVPQVADAVDIPVFAAGGIGDGRGIAAAFMLGAAGVQMGTRFLAATETNIHENYKKAVVKAKDIDTQITGQYAGSPVRVLKNKMSKEFLRLEKAEAYKPEPDFAKLDELGNGSLRRAVQEGDKATGSFMAGEIAGLVKAVQPAAEIIQELVQETDALLQNTGRFI